MSFNQPLNGMNILEVISLAAMIVAGLFLILVLIRMAIIASVTQYAAYQTRAAARRKPVNRFRTDPNMKEFKDAIKSAVLVVIIVGIIIAISHGC